MDVIKSYCSSAWTYICDFVGAVKNWTIQSIKSFFSWLKTKINDIFAAIKNAMGKPGLSAADKEFLKEFEKDLQNVNNKLPKVQEICEKAQISDSLKDKQDAADIVKQIGQTIRAHAG